MATTTWREEGGFGEIIKKTRSLVLKFLLYREAQFTVNVEHSLERSDQQAVQPGVEKAQREHPN